MTDHVEAAAVLLDCSLRNVVVMGNGEVMLQATGDSISEDVLLIDLRGFDDGTDGRLFMDGLVVQWDGVVLTIAPKDRVLGELDEPWRHEAGPDLAI